jgi:hypothetical protein
MPLPQVLRKFSHPNLARSARPDSGSSASDDSKKPPQRRQASEAMPNTSRWWRAKRSSTRPSTPDSSNPSGPTFTYPPMPSPKSEDGTNTMPSSIPLPATASELATSPDKTSSPEMIPTVPDRLAEAWDAIKDGPNVSASRRLDTIGASSVPPFQW